MTRGEANVTEREEKRGEHPRRSEDDDGDHPLFNVLPWEPSLSAESARSANLIRKGEEEKEPAARIAAPPMWAYPSPAATQNYTRAEAGGTGREMILPARGGGAEERRRRVPPPKGGREPR